MTKKGDWVRPVRLLGSSTLDGAEALRTATPVFAGEFIAFAMLPETCTEDDLQEAESLEGTLAGMVACTLKVKESRDIGKSSVGQVLSVAADGIIVVRFYIRVAGISKRHFTDA